MLEINKITKNFGSQKVLDELSLKVNNSSIFGLVGINGAGKSTLLRCIAGVYDTDAGFIEFNGQNTYLDEKIRKDIFFVNDEPFYQRAATTKTLNEFYESFYNVDEKILNKYLDIFKLDKNKPIISFSKGMKRQTLLAFAMAIKPKLLLLDEAFDGLDPLVRVTLKEALTDFISDGESSIIISSHNLKELEDICDSYGMLENGKIQTYGDLLESKANINKYQVAFKKEIKEEDLKDFNILYKNKEGSIYTFVIKGNKEEIIEKLNSLNPLILDVLNVNFEEMFIYEHKGGIK